MSVKNPSLLDFSTANVKDTEWRSAPKPYLPCPFKRGTTSGESHYLYELAKEFQGGRIAEVGIMHGGNTTVLGQGLQTGTLYAVDLFELYEFADRPLAMEIPGRVEEYFRGHLPTLDLRICLGDSSTVGQDLNALGVKLDFVFIDGDHSYTGCKRDWEAWSPIVKVGGVIAFHDCHIEGVANVINEIDNTQWQFEKQIFSIKSFRKTASYKDVLEGDIDLVR